MRDFTFFGTLSGPARILHPDAGTAFFGICEGSFRTRLNPILIVLIMARTNPGPTGLGPGPVFGDGGGSGLKRPSRNPGPGRTRTLKILTKISENSTKIILEITC